MVDFISYKSKPFQLFKDYFDFAVESNQQSIEAMCVSSVDLSSKQPHSRFVNLKYVNNNQLIFFSNYESNKAKQFNLCSNVSCVFFWPSINIQIRINGVIERTSANFSDEHFLKRSRVKNALSISSDQSSKISSFDEVVCKFNKVLKKSSIDNRPPYWGGYSITPNYFEFWKGSSNRLNKREEYKLSNDTWIYSILEP